VQTNCYELVSAADRPTRRNARHRRPVWGRGVAPSRLARLGSSTRGILHHRTCHFDHARRLRRSCGGNPARILETEGEALAARRFQHRGVAPRSRFPVPSVARSTQSSSPEALRSELRVDRPFSAAVPGTLNPRLRLTTGGRLRALQRRPALRRSDRALDLPGGRTGKNASRSVRCSPTPARPRPSPSGDGRTSPVCSSRATRSSQISAKGRARSFTARAGRTTLCRPTVSGGTSLER